MKLWNWERFGISLIVCAIVSFAVITLIFMFPHQIWPYALLLTLFLAAGFTFVKGLLCALDEQKKEIEHLRKRIREVEKKTEEQ